MNDWVNVARRLREAGMSWRAVSEQIGVPTHRVQYALSEQYRVNTYKRVQWARALQRARRAFGVEARP